MTKKTKYITKVGMLTAIAVLLMFFEIPILPSFPYLKLDFSDVPALLGGIAMGPIAAVVIELLKNLIHFVLKNDGTGGIGNLANFVIGVALVLPATWYYLKHKSSKGMIIALVLGLISAVIVGVIFNYFVLLPLYGMNDHSVKMPIIYGGIIPINAIKGTCAGVLSYLLYKPLAKLLQN